MSERLRTRSLTAQGIRTRAITGGQVDVPEPVLLLHARGVRVVEVALGPVDTPAARENRMLAGADRWLDGRPGLGNAKSAAAAIVNAAEEDAEGVVLYP